MDDNQQLVYMLYHGCTLAKDLENRLRTTPNPDGIADALVASCDEILAVFASCKERLQRRVHEHWVQDLFKSPAPGVTRPGKSKGLLQEGFLPSPQLGLMVGGGSSETAHGVAILDAPDSTRTAAPRPRRRNNNDEKEVKLIPAPQMGNLDLPPDDGHTWRKYGQKEILGSIYPRSYYRCTHQKFYGCPAKKLVQRLDQDPRTFKVTYRGSHTCHMSATAPSAGVPAADSLPPPMSTSAASLMQAASIPLNFPAPPTTHWLSMQNVADLGGAGGPGPSASRAAAEMPVADMADVMFNSGSSSSNSMDLIFSSEKWDYEEKKD
ncbi:WRKY transcription factor 55 [Andrographis paniculata]|uniref:WRKY transcription factor 55 n=1 Tax=Andrographis paniculata TaxID=175694 RepID=UPI0021E872B0|nr:WRKY transcription factor 55 [Andrographis paniculata]